MAYRSLCKGTRVENPREDCRSAARFGTFRIGSQAVYFPAFPAGGQYLAYPDLTKILLKPSSLHPKGCCGGGIPVFVLRLEYGENEGKNLVLDNARQAERVAEALKKACPGLSGGLEIPHTDV
ncbi:MAG: hypothetical protein K6C09_10955 [Oscillospiraceae bacterium]|nr:hypothetical protein [Oscillospiraceae bacterium]